MPVSQHGSTITVAISDPSDLDTVDSLHLLGAEIEIRVASEEDIENALNKYYGGKAGQSSPEHARMAGVIKGIDRVAGGTSKRR